MLHVDDIHRRIGGSFKEEHLGVRPNRLFPCVIVAAIDDGGFDPEARTQMIDEPTARAESGLGRDDMIARRSEEHTSELQSLMRISYAVFCLKKKTKKNTTTTINSHIQQPKQLDTPTH